MYIYVSHQMKKKSRIENRMCYMIVSMWKYVYLVAKNWKLGKYYIGVGVKDSSALLIYISFIINLLIYII